MASNRVLQAIEHTNLPSNNFADEIIDFCRNHEDVRYIPGEKVSIEKLKKVPGLEIIAAEISPIPDNLSCDEGEIGVHEDLNTILTLTIKVHVTSEDSIKEKLDAWVSTEYLEMFYLSHEVESSTASFYLIHADYAMEGYEVTCQFGDVIESPFLEDVWDQHMKNIITEGVCYIHGKVDVPLRDSLRKNIDHLANNSTIDYHPNSQDIVRDLVHPALYSYVKGVSKLKPGCQYEKKSNDSARQDYWGRKYEESKFQWLPTPFSISKDGKCTIMEYINNLDRVKFPELYKDLEQLFDVFLPYLEEVWSYVKATTFFRGESDDNFTDDENVPCEKAAVSFKGRELQIIVKIVEYTLQVGQTYEGVWHAEGMSHEHIVMTGIYFLDRDIDITGGELRFKRAFTLAERNKVFYNVPQGRPSIINKLTWNGFVPLGKFPTEEGYLLVFPNCHIHKISKFINTSLNKASSRRIVVFFVVDPDQSIISTQDVAPQQDEIDINRAKTYRLELMSERKYNKDKLNVRDIELCEH